MDKPSEFFVNEFITAKVTALTLKVARGRLLAASAQLAALRIGSRRDVVRYAEKVVLAWHDRVWDLQQQKGK